MSTPIKNKSPLKCEYQKLVFSCRSALLSFASGSRTLLHPPEQFFYFCFFFTRSTKRLFCGLNFNLSTSASEMKINGDVAAETREDNTGRTPGPQLTGAGPLSHGCTSWDQTPPESLLHLRHHRWDRDGHGGERRSVRAAAAHGKSTRPRGQIFTSVHSYLKKALRPDCQV